MSELTIRVQPFATWGDHAGELSREWDGDIRSLDAASTDPFTASDVDEVLHQADTGDAWDGTAAAVFNLKDGRFVAYETFWGPTGDGFNADAYGGNAVLYVALDLRLLVNMGLTDEGRRLCGVPLEMWNL